MMWLVLFAAPSDSNFSLYQAERTLLACYAISPDYSPMIEWRSRMLITAVADDDVVNTLSSFRREGVVEVCVESVEWRGDIRRGRFLNLYPHVDHK